MLSGGAGGRPAALGLFEALLAALPGDAEPFGVVEVPGVDLAAAAALVPPLHVIPTTAAPGDAVLDWLTGQLPREPDVAYLAGHAQSIQQQRALLCEGALRRKDVVTKPFWATGKAGL